VALYFLAEGYWKIVTIKTELRSLTRQYQLTSLGSLALLEKLCMMHVLGLNIVRCKPHLIRCCGRNPVEEEGVRMEQLVSATDQSWLILRDLATLSISVYGTQTVFFKYHSLVIFRLQYFYTYFAFRWSLASSGFSWQDSPSFYHLEICFALGYRWRATTVTFSLKDFYVRYFIAAGLRYAQIIHRRLSYERAKIWEILRRIEHRRCKRRITLLFILRTWAHELRGFKSLLAFSFRLDRTKHEREINYTCLYIVSKYGLPHPSE